MLDHFERPEAVRVANAIAYLEVLCSHLRFGDQRGTIGVTIGRASPYAEYVRVKAKYAQDNNPQIREAFKALTARFRKHSKRFLMLCEKHTQMFDREDRALALLDTLRIMEDEGFDYQISDKLKRKLMVTKLAHAG